MNSGEILKRQVDELWQKHLPLMWSRVEVLERAVEALNRGAISDDLKLQAAGEAHKLAGSLGSFGLERASDSAHQIETLLAGETIAGEQNAAEIRRHFHLVKQAIESR